MGTMISANIFSNNYPFICFEIRGFLFSSEINNKNNYFTQISYARKSGFYFPFKSAYEMEIDWGLWY